MKISYSFLFFLLFSGSYISLSQTISGKVLDANSKKPIENVNIYLSDKTSIGTNSGSEGFFSFQIPKKVAKKDSIRFSVLGYKTFTIALNELLQKANIILLEKQATQLKEVNVSTKRKQNFIRFKKIGEIENNTYSFASLLIDDKIYISGGDTSTEEDSFKRATIRANEKSPNPTFLDVINNWEPSFTKQAYSNHFLTFDLKTYETSIVSKKIYARAYHNMNYYDGELYILGGKYLSGIKKNEYLSNKIEVVDIEKNTIQIDKTNPHQAINFASFVYKDNIVAMGGSLKIKKDGRKKYSDKIHQYNIKTGYWFEIGKMKTPKETSGILFNDKFYVFGGFKDEALHTIESWNVTTGVWKQEGELFREAEKPAVTKDDTTIFIYHHGLLMQFNPIKKSLKSYRINLYLKDAKLHFYNDSLYIIGGYRETGFSKEPSSAIYKIDISEFNRTKVNKSKIFN